MGNDQARENVERIREARRTNIMLIGDPGQGKTALANSIYRIICDDSQAYPFVTSDAMSISSITFSIQSLSAIRRFSNIFLFDTPGQPYTSYDQENILRLLLRGVRDGTTVANYPQLANYSEPINRIDMCIIVMSSSDIEEKQIGWLFSTATINHISTRHIDRVVEIIRTETGHYPFFVVSNANARELSETKIRQHLATCNVPTANISFIENYTHAGQHRKYDTDLKLSQLLLTILAGLDRL